MPMSSEMPRAFEDIIKCVVVGDSGVGKTCLICAHACKTQYTLQQLVKTHQATVWAIDHYQHDKEILENSWCDVDGCRVSLRLWDTFGYHDKDRRFAYRGADVIVVCFSVMSPHSLRSVERIWLPEINKYSPSVPIVLCGTQADMRYMCFNESYIKMEKGLLYRNICPEDTITPSVGREVANEIGAPYYETSVLTHYGVSDVFVNAVRTVLIKQRKIRFWKTQLRKVGRPQMQIPMEIPALPMPHVRVSHDLLKSDISALLNNTSECDITFLVGNRMMHAHRICLAVAANFFQDLFSLESLAKLPARRRKNHHLRNQYPERFSATDSEFLLDSDQDSCSTDTDCGSSWNQDFSGGNNFSNLTKGGQKSQHRFPLIIPYDHKAVDTIEIRYEEDSQDPNHKTLQTYVKLTDEICPSSFRVILEYLYTGSLQHLGVDLAGIRKTAELLQLTDLMAMVDNVTSSQDYLNLGKDKEFHEKRVIKLRELALNTDFLTDITFQVDDGHVSAHKALLMGRCQMMFAMFSNDFIESASDVIPFPGVNKETFLALKEYLYTGESPCMYGVDCVALMEVANRLFLPQLISMVEASIVPQLLACENENEMLEDVLTLVAPSELYNANQLSRFCQYILSVHYHQVVQQHNKLFLELPKDKQDQIEKQRWPPAWHLKEIEQHKHFIQGRHHSGLKTGVSRRYTNRCGCLCFGHRGQHRLKNTVELPT